MPLANTRLIKKSIKRYASGAKYLKHQPLHGHAWADAGANGKLMIGDDENHGLFAVA